MGRVYFTLVAGSRHPEDLHGFVAHVLEPLRRCGLGRVRFHRRLVEQYLRDPDAYRVRSSCDSGFRRFCISPGSLEIKCVYDFLEGVWHGDGFG
jgi:hypothetical protein